jgi:DNA repair exonuclease SbcCD nuclease subunit
MKARFLHFADSHLGYWQYNHRERYNDFGRAFYHVIDAACKERVDFVILAGDLFHKRAIEALTLNQAMSALERLRDAGIPCIAVEGNHELAYHDERLGWVEMLAMRQLLVLLHPKFVDGEPQLVPYSQRQGSYIDPVPGLRVYGLRYAGSATDKAIERYAAALAALPRDGIEYTIFLTHAGVEGVLPDKGGLSLRQWGVLRPYVDYLALGHIHKPYEFDGWIYNPGSLESCSITETAWPERGYYLVEVDTDRPQADGEPRHRVELRPNRRRTFHRLTVKTDLHNTPELLCDHCRDLFQRKARDVGIQRVAADQRPVVEVQLHGVLPFDRNALDLRTIEQLLVEAFDPLLPLIKNMTQPVDRAFEAEEGLSRADLERQVVNHLLQQDSRFRDQSEQWTEAALALKNLALGDAAPDAILTELANRIETVAAAATPAAPGESQSAASS